MVRAGVFAVVAVALALSREPGCGGVDDPQGGKNAPCTRNSDCKSGLKCSEGVCVDTTTTSSSGSSSGGTSSSGSSSGGTSSSGSSSGATDSGVGDSGDSTDASDGGG